jgi:Na+-driven multidrug efflux pump
VVGTAWAIGALVQVPGGVAFVLDGVLMGAEDWAYLRTWTIAAAVAAGAAAQVVPTLGGGLPALWWCVMAMMVARAVSLLVRVRGDAWLHPERRTVATAVAPVPGEGPVATGEDAAGGGS